MCSIRLRWPGLCLIAILLACTLAPATHAQEAEPPPEIWLVTYGPGEIYWQRFGHNAIWVRDPSLGLDHTFNFGFFDFGQQDFFLRFLMGRMLYFSAAQPANEEFSAYIDDNRSIRAQRLDLDAVQATALVRDLLREIQPENRDYLYDYYSNNCSTRVRDALDLATGGSVRAVFDAERASYSWRDHTRRLTAADFWLYLGLEIVLGAPVDGPRSRWEEMFIPEVLAEAMTELEAERANGPAPLVAEDVALFASSLPQPPNAPRGWWPRYLLLSLLLLALVVVVDRLAGRQAGRRLARAWLLLAGVAGLALLFFWFGTDHSVARLNMNLLVFSPLWLWPALRPAGAGASWPLALLLSLAALLMTVVPPGQYTLDVLAAFLPLNLAAGYALRRN